MIGSWEAICRFLSVGVLLMLYWGVMKFLNNSTLMLCSIRTVVQLVGFLWSCGVDLKILCQCNVLKCD